MVDLSRTEYPRCAVLLMRIWIRRLSTGFIRSSRPSASRSDVTLRCSGHRRLALIDCTASSNWPPGHETPPGVPQLLFLLTARRVLTCVDQTGFPELDSQTGPPPVVDASPRISVCHRQNRRASLRIEFRKTSLINARQH